MISTTPEKGLALNPAGIPDPVPTLRILQVEDNEEHRRILAMLLNKKIATHITLARVEILAAATMAHGLETAPIANCTILDLTLPDSSIAETIAKIRQFRPPVIVITGTDDPEVKAQCLAAGAEHTCYGSPSVVLCDPPAWIRINGRKVPAY